MKDSAAVVSALSRIYKRGPLQWPKLLYVDPGCEFMGSVSELLATHNVSVRCCIAGADGAHRRQSIVERCNRTLAERLFGHQYVQEMRFVGTAKDNQRSGE